MSSQIFPVAKVGFTWVAPTTNTDGSTFDPAEVTGFEVGVRADGDATHSPGKYAVNVVINDPKAVAEPFSALGTVLAPGNYWGAVRADGPTDSDYSAEVPFSIAAPVPPTPSAPSAFTVS